MRANVTPIAGLREQALRHLERNVSVLPDEVARLLVGSRPVQCGEPQLIALDAAEINRVVDFQWSPYYSGTDIYSAIAADPIPDGGHCHDLLARHVRRCVVPGVDVVFPYAFASRRDSFLANVAQEWASFNDIVLFICRFNERESAWLESFDDTRRQASVAGSFDVGVCSKRCPGHCAEWTGEAMRDLMASAICVFAAALDGEGYLLWTV
jgi:hypothetical protein